LFYGDKAKNCFKCAEGFGPKSVTGLAVSKCLFCDDELQTWYVFDAKGKMKCTNCEGLMPSRMPLVPEQCPACFEMFEHGLMVYKGESKCLGCFRIWLSAAKLDEHNKDRVYELH